GRGRDPGRWSPAVGRRPPAEVWAAAFERESDLVRTETRDVRHRATLDQDRARERGRRLAHPEHDQDQHEPEEELAPAPASRRRGRHAWTMRPRPARTARVRFRAAIPRPLWPAAKDRARVEE